MQEADMLREIASEAARAFWKELLPRIPTALRRMSPWQRREVLKSLPAALDDCVTDLGACFSIPGPASFTRVLWNLGIGQPEEWKVANDTLSVAQAWFQGWNTMRRAVGENVTPEFFAAEIESLNKLLFWTGRGGERLVALFALVPETDLIRKQMHGLVESYNRFLGNYEALLRRLPTELNVQDVRTVAGMEVFFVRLQNPSVGAPRA